MGLYEGSALLWRTRRIRRLVRPPVVWWRHRGLSPADGAIVSYPRSGSTWFASMIAELMIGADPDFGAAHRAVPEVADARKTPLIPGRTGRVVRSHEPWRAEYARSIYLVRDPRDVAVSYYHYRRWLREYNGSLSEFVGIYSRGLADTYGPWDDHVTSWVTCGTDRALVVRFEELLADTEGCLASAASFLGIAADQSAVRNAVGDNVAAMMRAKERAAHSGFSGGTDPRRSFVRSARSGDWRTELAQRDVQVIERAFHHAMELVGYEISEPGSGSPDAPSPQIAEA